MQMSSPARVCVCVLAIEAGHARRRERKHSKATARFFRRTILREVSRRDCQRETLGGPLAFDGRVFRAISVDLAANWRARVTRRRQSAPGAP